jgi:cysteine desulfurase IscS
VIYLDHAATTPLDARVREAMLLWLGEDEGYANPASTHAPGRAARAAVEAARAQVAALIGAQAEEIVWTSGATEADNLAIKGAVEFHTPPGRRAHVITARTEHRAVLDPCRYLETRGVRLSWLEPNADGRIDPAAVVDALTPETVLVSLMWVNNETGAVNDIPAIAALLRARGVLLHCDAAQAPGRVAIDLARVPVDLLTLSAHKMYGPKGVGALFVRRRPRARLAPQMHGGGHEWGMRSGTLPTHQLVGMGEAARLVQAEGEGERQRLAALREQLWQRLDAALSGLLRNGDADGAAHLLNVSFPVSKARACAPVCRSWRCRAARPVPARPANPPTCCARWGARTGSRTPRCAFPSVARPRRRRLRRRPTR